jgi:thiosulfate/3-mercaptopyruvate sulfurtransferase
MNPSRQFRHTTVVVATGAALLAGRAAAQQPADSMLVSTSWLAQRLGDPSLVVLQAGNPEVYQRGHIPGARLLRFEDYAPERDGLHAQLPDPAQLEVLLRNAGISNDSRIVVYQPAGYPTPAARLFVTLVYAGLGERTSLLDGGLPAWEREQRPLSQELPTVAAGTVSVRPHEDLVIDYGRLHEGIQKQDVLVLDARMPNFYSGEAGVTQYAARPGHIAQARNVPFQTLTDQSGRFNDRALLQRAFGETGASPGASVVTYCHVGQQASLLYFVARYLGFNAQLYDGSFEEWSRRSELPVEGPTGSGR